jgi:RNA polymerase sigma factor (sigma-70 family)
MATSSVNRVIQHISHVLTTESRSDGQLLGCFVEHRDEDAFAALVRRHSPMVWGVCRRLLDHQDAEDATQAAFLVLVHKAASVVPREMVANWLYGVAHQIALQARRTAARRNTRERQVTEMPEPAVVQQHLWHDLRPLLDQELSRLPVKYRILIVLCDLEGKTRKEVARQFGLPEGTVAGRLARARTMLAKRLAKHGLAVSGGALATVLAQNAASASVPASVVSASIKAASLVAGGQFVTSGAISVKVAALTEGALKSMLITKLKVVMVLLVVAAALSGAAGLIYNTQASEQPIAEGATEKADDKKPLAAKKDEKPKSDKERLQGTWKVVYGDERDGKCTFTFTTSEITIKTQQPLAKEPATTYLRFRLDEMTNPKGIDVEEGRPGEWKGEWALGIYSLDGDTLRICVNRKKGERPAALFNVKPEDSFFVVLKREPKGSPVMPFEPTKTSNPKGSPDAMSPPAPVPVPSAQPMTAEPLAVVVNSRRFKMPFNVEKVVQEITLLVSSDGGKSWERRETVSRNNRGEFMVVVPKDGEFLFSVETVDAAGRSHKTPPLSRVIVRTGETPEKD